MFAQASINGTRRAAVIVIIKMKEGETTKSGFYFYELFLFSEKPLIITTTPKKETIQKSRSFLFIFSFRMKYDKTKVAIGDKFLVID